MKRHVLLFLMFILMNASFAMAEWSGDTLEPKLEGGCYQIGSPEELVWVGPHVGPHSSFHCVKLVADIVFGKDKKTVNREHPLKVIETAYANLDFNGYTVYGAYTEDYNLLVCSYGSAKDISFKNFEMNVKSPYFSAVSPVMIRDSSEGNVITEGVIKVSGDTVNVRVEAGSFIDGVLENRTPIIVESPFIERLWIRGTSSFETLGIDSSLVHEAVNYADITVKADSAYSITVGGVCRENSYNGLRDFCILNSHLYKLSNYGNINIDVKNIREVIASGVGFVVFSSDTLSEIDILPEIYNEGNIFINADSLEDFDVGGISSSIVDYARDDIKKFSKALNRGNITVLANYADDDGSVGGCSAHCGNSENLVNEGNVEFRIKKQVSGGRHDIGGVCGTGGLVKSVVNLGKVHVSYDEVWRTDYVSVTPPSVIGGLVATIYDKIERSVNFGTVDVEQGTRVGGAVGLLDRADASQVMNFGAVTAKHCSYIGGVAAALDGSCMMRDGKCLRDPQYLNDLANFADVVSYDSLEKSVGGILGESYEDIHNSYNAGRAFRIVSADSTNLGHPLSYVTTGRGPSDIDFYNTFYDWNVFYGTKTQPEWIWFEKKARTTSHMQSKDFVKELNYVDSTNTNSKVWTLSKLYPYPIIADMEDILKENKDRLPIIPVRKNKSVASFGLSVEGMCLLVSGARVGTPYAVFNLLGKSIARGRISSQNQIIPVVNAGTYVVKVGKSSRSIVVK